MYFSFSFFCVSLWLQIDAKDVFLNLQLLGRVLLEKCMRVYGLEWMFLLRRSPYFLIPKQNKATKRYWVHSKGHLQMHNVKELKFGYTPTVASNSSTMLCSLQPIECLSINSILDTTIVLNSTNIGSTYSSKLSHRTFFITFAHLTGWTRLTFFIWRSVWPMTTSIKHLLCVMNMCLINRSKSWKNSLRVSTSIIFQLAPHALPSMLEPLGHLVATTYYAYQKLDAPHFLPLDILEASPSLL